jgi:hypothetical protein
VKARAAKQLYYITLYYASNITRTIKVKASSREVAEQRALKRNPGATGVRRDA